MRRFQYKRNDHRNKRCKQVVISERAYAAIISEVLKNGRNETGGVLVGNIVNGVWYVIDSLDPGMETTNTQDFFQWDAMYVNHLVDTISLIYYYPVTILGFWHRHPGSMDFFSLTDEDTIRSNLEGARFGLVSMLVNLDPELRMTFYYCWEESLFRVSYAVGDEYFPTELLKYATPSRIANNIGTPEAKRVEILPNKVYSSEVLAKTIHKKEDASSGGGMQQHAPERTDKSFDAKKQPDKAESVDSEVSELLSHIISQESAIKMLEKDKLNLENEKHKLEIIIEDLKEQLKSIRREQENSRITEISTGEETAKVVPVEDEKESLFGEGEPSGTDGTTVEDPEEQLKNIRCEPKSGRITEISTEEEKDRAVPVEDEKESLSGEGEPSGTDGTTVEDPEEQA